MYGIDDTSLLPIDDNPEYVNVPSINLDLSAEVVARLRQQVHPLSQSQNHGFELYEQAYIWSVVLLDFMYMNQFGH